MPIYYEAKALERTIDTAPRITPSTKSVLKKIIRSAPVADVVKVTRCKPEEMRRMIELVSYEPRIEIFARERFPGWDAWGDEV